MDLPTFKNKIQRKWFQNVSLILLFLTLITWLFVVSINVQYLKESIDAKKQVQVETERRKSYVNKYIRRPYYEVAIQYFQDDIYTKLGNYGYFFKFEKAVTFWEAERSCKDMAAPHKKPNTKEGVVEAQAKEVSAFASSSSG